MEAQLRLLSAVLMASDQQVRSALSKGTGSCQHDGSVVRAHNVACRLTRTSGLILSGNGKSPISCFEFSHAKHNIEADLPLTCGGVEPRALPSVALKVDISICPPLCICLTLPGKKPWQEERAVREGRGGGDALMGESGFVWTHTGTCKA